MQAHFDAIGPGRKKMRKSRSKKKTEEDKKKDSLLVHIALNTAQKEDSKHPIPTNISNTDPETPSGKANKSLVENAKKGFVTGSSSDIDALLKDETQPADDKIPMPELQPTVDLNEGPHAETTSPNLAEEEKTKSQEISLTGHSLKETKNVVENDSALEETPKKRRRRSPTKTVSKPTCTPVIVDMQPLLEEVRMGRYVF